MFDLDPSKISLRSMWELTLAVSLATAIITYLLRARLKLGVRVFTTWNRERLAKIYEEYGTAQCLWSLVMLVLFFNHYLHVIVLWAGAIAWSLGYYTPPTQ